MHAQSSVAVGMKGASKAMEAMNKTGMMSEAIDDALDNDEADEETKELTNQALDEIGVAVALQLSAAPKGSVAVEQAVMDARRSGTDELEKRLPALRDQ